MRTVVKTDEGVLELNWAWLPTFIGMSAQLKKEIELALSGKLVGRALDEETLDLAHGLVVDFLKTKFLSIHGIDEYLDSLKYVYYQ